MCVLGLNCSFKMNTRKKIIPVEISAVQWDKKKKKDRIICQRVIFFAVRLAQHTPPPSLAPLAEVIVLKGKASESETDHLTSTGSTSTSAGIHSLLCLITLQSSTGTLCAVNYFTKQWGDVPRRTEQRAPERVIKRGEETMLKSGRAGVEKKERLSNKDRERRCEKKGSGKMKRGESRRAWARGVPVGIILPQTSCAAGDRPALMNKVPNFSDREDRHLQRRDVGVHWQIYISPAPNADKYGCLCEI